MLLRLVQHRVMALIELAIMINMICYLKTKMAGIFTVYSTLALLTIKKIVFSKSGSKDADIAIIKM